VPGGQKPRKRYLISEERILQISNDIAEDMCRASAKELIEVVKYFRDEFDRVWRYSLSVPDAVALKVLSLTADLMKMRPPPG
jgi:hypothetical protein